MGQSAEQLRAEIEDTRGGLGETLDAIGDRLSPSRMVERRKNRAINTWQSARNRVMGSASDTGQAVSDAASGAIGTLASSPDAVREQARGNPLAAGAVSFGLGVLLASVFPATEKEKQAASQLADKAEPLKQDLMETGREVAEHLKEPAHQAVEQVKSVATEGTTAVTEAAKSASDTAAQSAQEAADNVRGEASGDGSPGSDGGSGQAL